MKKLFLALMATAVFASCTSGSDDSDVKEDHIGKVTNITAKPGDDSKRTITYKQDGSEDYHSAVISKAKADSIKSGGIKITKKGDIIPINAMITVNK